MDFSGIWKAHLSSPMIPC